MSAKILDKYGEIITPPSQEEFEKNLSPVDKAIIALFNALTPTMKAALTAGFKVHACLTMTEDGSLSMVVDLDRKIRAIDTDKKVIYAEEQEPEASPVSVEPGEPAERDGEVDPAAGVALRSCGDHEEPAEEKGRP